VNRMCENKTMKMAMTLKRSRIRIRSAFVLLIGLDLCRRSFCKQAVYFQDGRLDIFFLTAIVAMADGRRIDYLRITASGRALHTNSKLPQTIPRKKPEINLTSGYWNDVLFSYTIKHIPAPPYSRISQFFLYPDQLVVLGNTVRP
jgi:hypothetical protein